ncbi:pregnancy zone protein [Pimephales promelas]|nr:pregnancy zone protein [Pimephales promelas]
MKSPNTTKGITGVLPKFDVTVNAQQTYSVAVMGLKVESCAKYTYGQPVPGQALEKCAVIHFHTVCFIMTRQCLTQTADECHGLCLSYC